MEWCSHYGIGADASMYWSSDMQEHWSADGQCMKASPYSNSIPRHMMGYCSKFGSCAWACIKRGEKNLTPGAPLLVGYLEKFPFPQESAYKTLYCSLSSVNIHGEYMEMLTSQQTSDWFAVYFTSVFQCFLQYIEIQSFNGAILSLYAFLQCRELVIIS